ncbi:MAG: 3-oxo-5-alpha-steroid 4-dehydrogenase [Candidatus Hermodarchaeota archaeon]
MTELDVFNFIIILMFILAMVVFLFLFFKPAPYDRYVRKGWGPVVNNTLGWIIMEVPASIMFTICFIVGDRKSLVPIIFLIMFNIHYIYRGFIFPFQMRGKTVMPLIIALSGATFNLINAYINARWIYTFSGNAYSDLWLITPQFIFGFILFYAGVGINLHSDHITRNLRKPGEKEMIWKIPYGGFHEYVASPNYFGEITEWLGWAIITWSLPGLVFAVWTFANLAPRSNSHWKWYRTKFGDEYPQNRKRLIPFIW